MYLILEQEHFWQYWIIKAFWVKSWLTIIMSKLMLSLFCQILKHMKQEELWNEMGSFPLPEFLLNRKN